MKRLLCALLCAVLAVSMLPAALAENAMVQVGDSDSIYVREMLTVGDTVYMLVNEYSDGDGMCLYSWKPGQEQALQLVKNLAEVYDGMSEEDLNMLRENGQDVEHAITLLFTDGASLMAMNCISGLIFRIVPGEAGVTYEDMVTVSNLKAFIREEEDYSYFATPEQSLVVNGTLLCMVPDYTPDYDNFYRLVRVDLKDGATAESAVKEIREIIPYKDGKALLLQRQTKDYYDNDKNSFLPFTLAVYDADADTAQSVGTLDVNEYQLRWTWCDALQAPVWVDGGRIMALVDDLKTTKQVGFLPVNYANRMAVMGTTLVCADYDKTLYVRDMSLDFNPEASLNLYGLYSTDARLLFNSRYPNVPVYDAEEYYSGLEAIAQAMVTGSDSLDILCMSISYSQFTTMLRKGYCADLSASSAITDAVGRMYPVFQEAVKNKNGAICAVPISAWSSGWYVNRYVMEDVGLTMEDMPTNYIELCQFVTRWNEEFADEYDMYTVFSTSGADYMKNNLFDYILRDYINYCQATTGSVRFNTDLFRSLVAAVESVECRDIRPTYEESGDGIWRDSLLDYGFSVVGNFRTKDEDDYAIMLPMALTADTEVINTADVDVVFVNPRSKQFDLALRYVECVLETVEKESTGYVLFADKTEPRMNEYYETAVKQMERDIAELEEAMKNADESERREYEEGLASQREWLEEYKAKYRYDISPEGLAYYQTEIVPTIAVGKQTFLNASSRESANAELQTLIKRYKEGQIKIDQFIKEADNKLTMMEMEDQ